MLVTTLRLANIWVIDSKDSEVLSPGLAVQDSGADQSVLLRWDVRYSAVELTRR